VTFNEKEHYRYLNFLKQGIQICAPDVMQDNRLVELYDTYLQDEEIKAVIDTPIFVEDKL
jgi:GAF domain-containing protein